LLYRLVGPSQDLRRQILETAGNEVKVDFPLEFPSCACAQSRPAYHDRRFHHRYSCANQLGRPLLIGPGSIHVAHTDGEFIDKQQLAEAIDLYCTIAKRLVQL